MITGTDDRGEALKRSPVDMDGFQTLGYFCIKSPGGTDSNCPVEYEYLLGFHFNTVLWSMSTY